MSTSDRTAVSSFDRVAADLAHVPFPAIAAAIRARIVPILKHWREIGLKVMPHLEALTLEEFEDTIAEILSAAADALKSADPLQLLGVLESGPRHGIDRFIQKQSLLDLFEEVRILRRVVIIEIAQEMQRPIQPNEAASFHAIFDIIVQQAVMTLVQKQNEILHHSETTTREMNERLLVSSIRQHELIQQSLEAQKALVESEQRFRALADNIDQLAWTCDRLGNVTWYNQRWLEYTGLSFEEMKGWNWSKVQHPDHVNRVVERVRESSETGEPWEDTFPLRGKDGRYRWFLSRAVPIKDETGAIARWVGTNTDVTEQRGAADALRESTERYRKLFQSVPAAVFDCDRNGVLQDYNRRAEEYWGRSPKRGDPAERYCGSYKLYHPDGTPLPHEATPNVDVLRDGRARENVEVIIERPDRSRMLALCNFLPLTNAEGEITGSIVCFTDISERKRFEDEREAHLANEQILRMQAETANRAKDLFLATLSHEMRTPLNAIVGWMSILRGVNCDEADMQEGLDVIDRNTKAQVQLIEDVLDVSRIVSGKLRLEIKPCDLADTIRAGMEVVRPAAEAKDITLEARLDPVPGHPPFVAFCDSARIQQVIWNLVSNAVKFTPKGGTVGVSLAREQSSLRIQVSDNGQGMSPELLPFVFERFRQADSSSRRKFGGLGLGLSIVKHLVEMHGGTVEARSAGEGKGATFIVRLPIKAVWLDESDSARDDAPANGDGQPESAAALPGVRLDGLRILVVDDEADARRLLSKVLEGTGAVVTTAASAAEALELLFNANPDVLVSDLGMPDRDGYDLIRQVRAGKAGQAGIHPRDLPAVALTAFVHKDDARQALLAGFQVHVPKPVDPHDLTAVIASLAGRTGTA